MRAHRSGFTLIELLVVIVIIVILMGIALQIAKTASDRTRRAQTVRTMEAVRNALAGYYTAYGQYPPTSNSAGTFPEDGMIPPQGDAKQINGSAQWNNCIASNAQHGLLFYLMAYAAKKSASPSNVTNNVTNMPWAPVMAEIETAKRWQKYLEGVPGITIGPAVAIMNFSDFASPQAGVTNRKATAVDGWGAAINYISPPPYQSYRLWSSNMTNGWEE